MGLTEDQTTQLLSAFWIQANWVNNKPIDFQAIAHSFGLTLLSSHLKVRVRFNYCVPFIHCLIL